MIVNKMQFTDRLLRRDERTCINTGNGINPHRDTRHSHCRHGKRGCVIYPGKIVMFCIHLHPIRCLPVRVQQAHLLAIDVTPRKSRHAMQTPAATTQVQAGIFSCRGQYREGLDQWISESGQARKAVRRLHAARCTRHRRSEMILSGGSRANRKTGRNPLDSGPPPLLEKCLRNRCGHRRSW